jgi:(2Fe-2S) ferredoxin
MAALDIFRRPAAPRRLLICTGPCCDNSGHASAYLAALCQLLVARGLAGDSVDSASCVRRSCLGKCSGEPLARVMPDDVWYHDLSAERLLQIYESHVLNGQPVASLVLTETG